MGKFVNVVGLADVISDIKNLDDSLGFTTTVVVGTSVQYGVHLEFGTEKMQAYPWLRPAVREFESDPESFIDKYSGTSMREIDDGDDLVMAVGLALERKMKANVTADDADVARSPDTEPGHPKVQTGNLRAGIQAVKL